VLGPEGLGCGLVVCRSAEMPDAGPALLNVGVRGKSPLRRVLAEAGLGPAGMRDLVILLTAM
jgi:hypothetical protein